MNLSKEINPIAIAGLVASTAGASTDYSDQIDTAGYSGCLFTALVRSTAASTGTATFSVVGTNTSTADSTSYSSINGASVSIANSTTAGTRWASIDIYLPKYRYLKSKISREEKIGVNGVLAQLYAHELLPTTPGSSTYAGATLAASNVLVVAGT